MPLNYQKTTTSYFGRPPKKQPPKFGLHLILTVWTARFVRSQQLRFGCQSPPRDQNLNPNFPLFLFFFLRRRMKKHLEHISTSDLYHLESRWLATPMSLGLSWPPYKSLPFGSDYSHRFSRRAVMNPMRLKESKQSLKTSKSKKVKFSKDETTTTPPPRHFPLTKAIFNLSLGCLGYGMILPG